MNRMPPSTGGLAAAPAPSSTETRPTFRRRLLVTIGSGLAVALTLLGLLVGGGIYAWLTHNAYAVLEAEIDEILAQVVSEDGETLHPERYNWSEPHHRFTGKFIDPFFVQIFDDEGYILRQSDNVTFFSAGDYPDRLLAYTSQEETLLPRLHTFEVDGAELYYINQPIRSDDGRVLGHAQVARNDPGIGEAMRRTGLLLGGGLVLTLLGLGLLLWWQAGRVLRPLATITQATETIGPERLHQRVPVPDESDQETAQLATTLNAQLEQLEQAFDEMYRFTANAAHELQTPLTVMRGHVDLALRRPREVDDYRDTLSILGDEIDTLTRMVRSLLTLARLDREATHLPREPVDLAHIVRTEAAHFRPEAQSKGLALQVETPPAVPIHGQPDLLREVVHNLLDNAVKYTPEGHIQVTVTERADDVTLTVEDTGLGMSADDMVQATDRFYRSTQVGTLDIPGSGLGLSLVAQIVRRHGGEMTLDSTLDEGTRITLILPVASIRQQTGSS